MDLESIAQKTTFPFANGNFGNAYLLGNIFKRYAFETFQNDPGPFYKTLFAFTPVDDVLELLLDFVAGCDNQRLS